MNAERGNRIPAWCYVTLRLDFFFFFSLRVETRGQEVKQAMETEVCGARGNDLKSPDGKNCDPAFF